MPNHYSVQTPYTQALLYPEIDVHRLVTPLATPMQVTRGYHLDKKLI